MKKIVIVFVFAALAVYLPSCKKKNNDPPANTASVMFINGCAPSTNAVDVKINNTNLGAVTNLAFLSSSTYQYITAGNSSVSFVLSGSGINLVTGSVSLTANQKYSVFAGGVITSPVFLLTTDDLTPSNTGAKVRFVNLSSENLNPKCFIGTTAIDSNRSYPSASGFISIAAGTNNILLQDPAQPTKLTQINSFVFQSGKIYTVTLTGNSSGTGTNALGLKVIANN